jgi:hypothetical protein
MKRILVVFLAAALIFALLPAAAFAAEKTQTYEQNYAGTSGTTTYTLEVTNDDEMGTVSVSKFSGYWTVRVSSVKDGYEFIGFTLEPGADTAVDGKYVFAANSGGTTKYDGTKSFFTVLCLGDVTDLKVKANYASASHSVTKEEGTGTVITLGADSVNDGGSLTFTVDVLEGYDASTLNISAAVGNEAVAVQPGTNPGEYVIENITGDVQIVTSDLELKKYSVTAQPANGTEISLSQTEVFYGGEIVFEAALKEGYTGLNVYASIGGGEKQLLKPEADGKYKISNITGNVVISTDVVVLAVYDITTSCGEGGSVTTSFKAGHGSDAVITVTAAEGYAVDKAYADGAEVKLTDGKYVFENVTAPHTFNVTFAKIPVSDEPEGGGTDADKTDADKTDADKTDSGSSVPKTGDSENIAFMIVLAAAAAAVIACALFFAGKKAFKR